METGDAPPVSWWRRLAQVFGRRPQALPWLDLTQVESDAGYNKKALRAIIARRRRNDWVRQRELEQLRLARHHGLRHGGLSSGEAGALFQGSPFSALDEREVTLRKIDDIEAQMSRQWWAKAPAPAAPTPDYEAGVPTAEFAPTQRSGPVTEAELALVGGGRAVPRQAGEVPGARASELDPDLAEAALRWAAGDGAQAEAILLRALRAAAGPDARALYLTALLDLYRATDQRASIDRARAEFADVAPLAWPLPDGGREPAGALELEATLTGDLTALLQRMTAACEGGRPLVLSCARLQRIDFAAAGALLDWLPGPCAVLELRQVSPLVTAFLRILGLDAQVRLIPRRV